MRVTDLQVDGFGVWSELHLDDLSGRVTVFYGANEAGKTTLMQFMRTVLYGFSPERRARYLPPVHGGRVGGLLQVENNHQQLKIQRHLTNFGATNEQEQFAVRAADDAVLSPALLDQLLTGIDEPTFNNVFAVGLRELQELGTLDDTDAAELLYKLTTGLDRVSLVDVMQELDSACRKLLDTDDPTTRILDLQQRRDQLQQRVNELAGNGRDWLALETRRKTLADEGKQLARRIKELTETSQIVDAALQTRDIWGKRAALERQLELLAPTIEIPETSLEQLKQLGEAIEEHQRTVARLKRRRLEIRQEVSLLPFNEQLWSQAARIEAMTELAPWIVSLQTQVEQLRGEVHGLEARLAHSSTPLGLKEEIVTDKLPDISRRTLSLLRAPARTVRDETQRLKQAQEEFDTARLQCDEMEVELETALLDQGQEDLAEAVERTGSDVSRLRRRLQLEQRLDELTHQKQGLQQDHRELLEDQVLSLKTLAWLGVPFVIGVMLVVGGLVWSSAASLGWPVAILGLAGWGVAVVAKISMERSAARDLEQCENQLGLLTQQIKQTQSEIDELTAQLPHNVGNLQRKMEESEKELATLEQLLPLEANMQTARQRLHTTQRRLEQLTESVKDARARWRSALRRADLPETLSPQAVRQLAEGNEHVTQARRQLEQKRAELASREQELATLAARVTRIAEQLELNYPISDPQQLLNHLSVAVSEQQALYERRKKMRQEDRTIQRQGQKVVVQLREASAQRRSILARTGVESETELREIAALAAQRRILEEEMEEINEQVLLAVGNRFEFELVERELIDHSKEELEERFALLVKQAQQNQADLAALHQQQGAVDVQSKTLLADRQLAETKLELGCIEQKLLEAVQRWRVLAVTAKLLETVRIIYETHRQPQTLIDASRYFEQLTEGQYVRIWTPLTDMSLRVDMASGESLPLDVLSCGTREAVFLSLRLALVADFTRRGVMLPLVLDDVLVNFDRQRARAAAKVLGSFAQQGHQVLMFTCHEHIVQLFKALQVAIRYLPNHAALDQPVVQLEEEIEEEIELEYDEEESEEDDYEEYVEDEEEEEIEDEDEDEEEEDAEYELEEAAEILEYDEADFLLEDDEEEEELEFEQEDEEEEEEEEEEVEAEVEVDPPHFEIVEQEEEMEPAREPRHQRFAWESPERWWDAASGGGAAA